MSKHPIALITGVTGQDGALLAEFLLAKGYVVHGVTRRASSLGTGHVDHLCADPNEEQDTQFFMHYGDMTDATNLIRLVQQTQPNEIYNLASQSNVQMSFGTAEYMANADALGTLRLLEALRISGMEKSVRFYQALSSKLFGNAPPPQNEQTPFMPRSPYAAAKLYAYWIVKNYREAYGIHASNGILFNHESPRRQKTSVSRKITRAVASIAVGRHQSLWVGNLDNRRDWGHARDFVDGMWRMVQQDAPDDFVLATGKSYSVRDFVVAAFAEIGETIAWHGDGLDEVGVCEENGVTRVLVAPQLFRPMEDDCLLGDATKAQKMLGWQPKITFAELVRDMMAADLAAAQSGG